MERKIIDVSKHQGSIDWAAVKASGIEGAIIHCGYGDDLTAQGDPQFKANVEGCIANGIPFGVYLYSYAKTLEQAKSEAAHVIRLLAPYKKNISYPIYLDLEEQGTSDGAVERAVVFGDMIERAGYWCGIYANQHWWTTFLKNNLDRFTKWVARYSDQKPEGISGSYDIWQYSSTGSVPGISGNVDMNICYRDFPAEINQVSATPAPVAPKKSIDEIANEVIAGKWGVDPDRKNRITAEGYNYEEVRARVNQILGVGAGGTVSTYYTIKSGDNLSKIAKQYGTTVAAIMKLNPSIKDANKIYPNQKIRVK